MKLFEAVHPDIFTILASPNKELYASALEVLYEAYQDHFKIPENTLYSMLRGKLEKQLSDACFEGEDIDEDELRDISGRTRFLMRKLCSRGWFEKERDKNFEENIIVPGYSSRLLELFHHLTSNETMRGYSYVFDTYSSLHVAANNNNVYDKMISIYSAYDNTKALIDMLRNVYHNIKHFFQIQVDMQNINEVLISHFDEFGQKVIEAYVRPLKIRDSVPKYRIPIQNILNNYLEDDTLLLAISNAALQDKRNDTLELCRSDILKMVFWIKEQYERIEIEYLDEIDQQVRRYTRATTQKLENLTNRDQNTRGNLNYLLTQLSQKSSSNKVVNEVQSAFQIYEQNFISERSLWHRKSPTIRKKSEPIIVEEEQLSEEMLTDAFNLLSNKYNKAEVTKYMKSVFNEKNVCYSKDLNIIGDYEYIMSIMAFLSSNDPETFYNAELMDGFYKQMLYKIPQIRFTIKE